MDLEENLDGLKRQTDLHIILLAAAVDLSMTFYGVLTGTGVEMNPLYRPFTLNPYYMVLGALIYLISLVLVSLKIEGWKRWVIGSAVFGMHVGGASSWASTVGPVHFNWWYSALLATLSTSMFYHLLYD
ncbi:MAG: DUF5658 family protein [Candidatus Nanohaloarchaea archaeon]